MNIIDNTYANNSSSSEQSIYSSFLKIAANFGEVNKQIDDALSEICYDKYGLSDETELVHGQFRRATGGIGLPDIKMDLDLALVQVDDEPDMKTLKRLSEKLQLRSISELKKESVALHEMAISSDEAAGLSLEKISSILKMLTDRELS